MRRWGNQMVLIGFVLAMAMTVANASENVPREPVDVPSSVLAEAAVGKTDTIAGELLEPSTEKAQAISVRVSCGNEETICLLPKDDVWFVSAQSSCACLANNTSAFATQRLLDNCWQDADPQTLVDEHQRDSSHVTIVFVHGNNTDRQWAITRGMQFYDRMFGCGSEHQECRPNVRLILLHWESERVSLRPLNDYKIKCAKAIGLGCPIAAFLDQLGQPRPVLVGYSLGVQVVLSTLDQVPVSECGDGFHVALIAPALAPNYACEQLEAAVACSRMTETKIFVNPDDRVVRAARLVSRKQCPDRSVEPSLQGLWRAGRLDGGRFQLFEIACEVRNRHSLALYAESPTIEREVNRLLESAAVTNLPGEIAASAETPVPQPALQSTAFDLP